MDNNLNNSEKRYKALQKISASVIASNAVLTILKILIGTLSGSSAVISDGINDFSDLFTTGFVMIGIKLSNKKADKEHPYGHQRIESVVSVFLSVFLAATALFLGYTGTVNLIFPKKLEPSRYALAVTAASIIAKETMFQVMNRKGKKYNSTAMTADAWHYRTDSVSSAAVLIGVAGVFFGATFLEPLATIAVCLLILYVAFGICKSAIAQLIDQSADKDVRNKIEAVALSVDGVKQIDLLKTRLSSNIIFAELEISVDCSLSVAEGHEIAQSVHDKLETMPELRIEHCMVHVNPFGIESDGNTEREE